MVFPFLRIAEPAVARWVAGTPKDDRAVPCRKEIESLLAVSLDNHHVVLIYCLHSSAISNSRLFFNAFRILFLAVPSIDSRMADSSPRSLDGRFAGNGFEMPSFHDFLDQDLVLQFNV